MEDYIGTAWGQDYYYDLYCGCPVYDKTNMELCFYRFHVPDPIYFNSNFKATIQQIGAVDRDDYFHHAQLLYKNQMANNQVISVDGEPVDFTNIPMLDGRPLLFEREDDWSCCSYFYLDKPMNNLPELMNVWIGQGIWLAALALWENILRKCRFLIDGRKLVWLIIKLRLEWLE